MRIVALIDDRTVIEHILFHLGLWEQGVRVWPFSDDGQVRRLDAISGKQCSHADYS